MIKKKILCVGDIHGNFITLKTLLKSVIGCIGKQNKWIGGSMCVIFIGDLIDRKTEKNEKPKEEIKIIKFLLDLDQQAKKTAGRVVLLVGNHEYMNLVEGNDISASQLALSNPNRLKELRMIYLNHPNQFQPFYKVGEYMVTHGSIIPEYIDAIPNAHKAFRAGVIQANGGRAMGKEDKETLEKVKQMLWDRKHKCMSAAQKKKIGVTNIVVGHTITGKRCEFERWHNPVQVPIPFPPYTKKLYKNDPVECNKIKKNSSTSAITKKGCYYMCDTGMSIYENRIEALQIYPKICVIQIGDLDKTLKQVMKEEKILAQNGRY